MTEKERDRKVRSYFPEPYQTSDDYRKILEDMVPLAYKLLPKDEEGDHAWLGTKPELVVDYEKVHEAKLSEAGQPHHEVMAEVAELFQGAPNWGSKLAMMNVLPQANKIGLEAFLFTTLFSPNIIEGEYAWNVQRAELEAGAMLGDMAWDDGTKSGCVFTYGGEAGWQYAVQYGKTRVFGESMKKGLMGCEGKVICSKVAQFSKQHSVVWAGVGTDNLIEIPINENSEMDMEELEKVLKDLHEKDIPIITLACTEGTTDANAFDDIEKAHELLLKYPNNPKKYGPAVLYADGVIGFTWIAYKGYDFEKNPMGFTKESLPIIKEMYDKASKIKYADCYSTDFHKSGFCPYVATSFNYRNREEFERIMGYASTIAKDAQHGDRYAYLQDRTPVNPMYYTLESSRSGAGSVAGWATLKYFGKDGFRLTNGWEVERHLHIRKTLEENSNIVCVNPGNHGHVTLFRIYDESLNAKETYEKELTDPSYKDELIDHNHLIRITGDILYDWYRTGKKIDGKYTPWMSYSTGFRPTRYNKHWEDKMAVVYGLKIYPLQLHSTDETFNWVVKCVKMAFEEAKKKYAAEKK